MNNSAYFDVDDSFDVWHVTAGNPILPHGKKSGLTLGIPLDDVVGWNIGLLQKSTCTAVVARY